MRIFCTIMVIFFLVFSVISTIGCALEWSGKCSTCDDHGDACNVANRARLYSAFATIILWVCSFTWCWLLWQEFASDRQCVVEDRVKGLSVAAEATMNQYLGKRK